MFLNTANKEAPMFSKTATHQWKVGGNELHQPYLYSTDVDRWLFLGNVCEESESFVC